MAGGFSTRFWPMGRRRNPKQLLSLDGRHTFLQDTARRLRPLVPWKRMLVVTNAAHADTVREQLPRIPPAQILGEPVGRDTAACLALANEWLAAHAGDAVMLAVPADHVIRDGQALRRSLATAARLAAAEDCLVTIGVRPTRAETGYGYIEVGERVGSGARQAFWVRRFREKPRPATAARYLASGQHLWNSGMFLWKVSAFQRALQVCLPQTARALRGAYAKSRSASVLRRRYARLPRISVDRGVLQPLSAMRGEVPRMAVLRASFDWLDAGAWDVLPQLWGTSDRGNTTRGKVVAVQSRDCIVYSPEQAVALVGVRDLIVVASDGVLLVCARDRAQDVRAVPAELKRRGWSKYV
jgi:mannose-1-phosphate guanylyltransferase